MLDLKETDKSVQRTELPNDQLIGFTKYDQNCFKKTDMKQTSIEISSKQTPIMNS